MKSKVIILALLVSGSIFASEKNICPINEDIAEDMRISESKFTKDQAKISSKFLAGVVDGSITSYNTFDVYNAQTLVTGYILRKQALETDGTEDFRIREFCSFMEQSAWWYD